MSISRDNIKTMASERMSDEEDGGGRQTAIEIVDGEVNNLFPDIARLDRVYGRVNLRKFFAAVITDTVDTYYGAHSIISDPPDDPNVGILLFSTDDHQDERAVARALIEAYVVRGPTAPFFLYDNQLEGQRSILTFQRDSSPLPEVGEVYYLVEDEGGGGEYSQYCRITSVDFEDRIFTTQGCGTFSRRVVTVGIGNALRHTFHGAAISCNDNLSPSAMVRETQVADASKYYGAVRLEEDLNQGDLSANAVSIYGQLVPSTRGEAPIVDVQAGGTVTQVFTSGGTDFDISGPAHTKSILIELANRAYNYVQTCDPIPAPGALAVDYRALGKWYRLRDNGSGELEGEGTGTVSYESGSVIVTLAALPDVGAELLFTWAAPVHYVDRAGSTDISLPMVIYDLGEGVVPGSATFTWMEGGVQKTATAATNGNISGNATGHLAHPTGKFWIEPATLPDIASQLQIDYDNDVVLTEVIAVGSAAGGHVNFSLATTPIKPGSIVFEWEVISTTSFTRVRPLYSWKWGVGITGVSHLTLSTIKHQETDLSFSDDGAGNIGADGTVDYATGAVDLEVVIGTPGNVYKYGQPDRWVSQSIINEFQTGLVVAKYIEDTGTPTTKQVIIDIPSPVIEFLPLYADVLIPGTVRFAIGGRNFSDRVGQGVLYWDDGTVAGTVDYEGRRATLEQHDGGSTVTIQSLVSAYGDWFDYEYKFRTPGSPLQPGSLQVNATNQGGDLITMQADASGFITHNQGEGFVNQDMGVVTLKYGELVLESTLTTEQRNEDWYDPADIDGSGYIWVPEFVFPNTVRYNTVIYTYLPLDADILGLDTVRLPSDGRVPIVRPGDVIVVHQDEAFALTNPLVADDVEQLPHTFIASCGLTDQAGTAVDELLYVVDRKLGRVTMANPLDLSAYTEPLIAAYRIENMALVSDVQIGGLISVVSPFSHNFDKTKAWLSTALIHGDMRARVKNFFHQSTWTGVWSDTRIGSDTVAKYNDVSFPLAVQNDAAIKERWLLQLTSSTTFNVIGETVGQIASHSITADLSPINPLTGLAYFTLLKDGWGSGWSTGNCIRFNTDAAAEPVWVSRCIVTGQATHEADEFHVQIRGDAD